ncbi:MAG: hypothetical protein Q4Q25_03940 [Methanocorpusculum sp.]|nr:hypothetical protein [Methanocorpusculum sp.]
MDCPYLVERLQSGKYGKDFFLKEALYPDQIVFLLGTLMFGSQAPGADQCAVDLEKGRLTFNMSDARAQVVVETMLCEVFVVETIQAAGFKLAYMGEAGKQFIANWESERYRRSLSGRK